MMTEQQISELWAIAETAYGPISDPEVDAERLRRIQLLREATRSMKTYDDAELHGMMCWMVNEMTHYLSEEFRRERERSSAFGRLRAWARQLLRSKPALG